MITIKVGKQLITTQGNIDLQMDLRIGEHDFVTLYGKSGAGKTTTLRILAGLTAPDSGYIQVGDNVWLDSQKGINLPPQARPIGFVFQDYALFPNMTVRKNLEYALTSRKERDIVDELLEVVDLKNLANRKPDTLSGGQRQRVALARALVRRPRILLLDEPLSALDMEMRLKLQDEILNIHRRFNITTILVSHNFSEIFKLSNRVLIIEQGKIIHSGPPAEVFIAKKLSGKFKFEGEILEKQKSDVVYILTVSIGNNLVKVIATKEEAAQLQTGDRVIVASKAFNPILIPVRGVSGEG
jgi:molybdate transport system ATP-binding protein